MPSAGPKFEQAAMFSDRLTKRPTLPVLDDQSDIRYFGTRARTILNRPEATGMDFWSINPYIGCALGCAYCYARYAHGYAFERAAVANPDRIDINRDYRGMIPWLAFERRILVKENAAETLRKTLRQGSQRHAALMQGETITIGTATDPYQPAERRFRITRSILEVLAEHPSLTIRIITKSPLVTRDVDVMRRIVRHSDLKITVSLISTDRDLARRIEPRAPTPDARLRAIRRLRESGIDVCVNVMPVLPGITDAPAQLDQLVKDIAAAGARHIYAGALHLRAAARKRYFPFIASEFPHLLRRYEATYGGSAFAGESYRAGLRQVMGRLCERHNISFGHFDDESDEALGPEALHQLELPFASTD
ncbi:MAG TPA: radical SAM protein [Gemmatimonadaceae bacterium]